MSDRVLDGWWDRLGWDLTELILSKLPLRSMIRASAVCKQWRAVLLGRAHKQQQPWLFLHGHNNVVPQLGRTAFAYDPRDGDSWVSLTLPPDCFAGAGGLAFSSSASSRGLSFAPLLRLGDATSDSAFTSTTPPLGASRCDPLVAAVSSSGGRLLVVVGGTRLVGGLVDIDEDPLPTEVLRLVDGDGNGKNGDDRWEQCAPLPAELGSPALWLSSAVVAGRFLFVCGTYSCRVSALDLTSSQTQSRRARTWTLARELRPAQGMVAAFLASGRGGQRLLLAGVIKEDDVSSFAVWDVDPVTLAARKIGEMPPELLRSMLPGSLRCVGEDGVLYVISDEQHRAYPACACEVVTKAEEEGPVACRWTRLPPLPVALTSRSFHKMVAFTSPVPYSFPLPASPPSISCLAE